MAGKARRVLPRLLVTGFEPFPGAPVNPTRRLVGMLRADPPALAGIGAFRAETLPVDYAAIGPRLSEIGRDFAPDIAIEFGLARSCAGFRLERVAQNRFASARPDNAGVCPADGPICDAPPLLPSTLPLQAIHDALVQERLPVEWSDDAGGYLCNMAMTLSLAGSCGSFRPSMAGFIHVPPFSAEGVRDGGFDEALLLSGALVIIECCIRGWQVSRRKAARVAGH
jgi:pyroglutamyl-peptidase